MPGNINHIMPDNLSSLVSQFIMHVRIIPIYAVDCIYLALLLRGPLNYVVNPLYLPLFLYDINPEPRVVSLYMKRLGETQCSIRSSSLFTVVGWIHVSLSKRTDKK